MIDVALLVVLGDRRAQPTFEDAGRDAVDEDAVGPELVSQAAGHPFERALAGGVVHRARDGARSGDGTDVHDATILSPQHAARRGPAEAEDSVDVELHELVPVGVLEEREGDNFADSRVVDEHVDAAPGFSTSATTRPGAARSRRSAQMASPVPCWRTMANVASAPFGVGRVGERDPGALSGAHRCDASSDSARAARDEHGAAVEQSRARFSSSRRHDGPLLVPERRRGRRRRQPSYRHE